MNNFNNRKNKINTLIFSVIFLFMHCTESVSHLASFPRMKEGLTGPLILTPTAYNEKPSERLLHKKIFQDFLHGIKDRIFWATRWPNTEKGPEKEMSKPLWPPESRPTRKP